MTADLTPFVFLLTFLAWTQAAVQPAKNVTGSVAAHSTQLAKLNTSDAGSNELSGGFMSFLENEELVAAGRESLRVFVKALKSNRTIDEALTIAVTAYATTRTAREIKGTLKNAKFALDRDFGQRFCVCVRIHA